MTRMRVALLTTFLTILTASHATACSLADGYLKPSNFDLVRSTAAIILAEAVSVDTSVQANGGVFRSDSVVASTTRFSQPLFTFRVIEVLKGPPVGATFVASGTEKYLGGSNANDFRSPREGAGTGACNAYDYAIGKTFLLFLQKVENEWIVSGPPFSRINEEVSAADTPWVEAVRHYIRIGSLQNYEAEKLELRNLQEAIRANRRQFPADLERDINSHFQNPYPAKSYQDLFGLYTLRFRARKAPGFVGVSRGKHKEAQSLVHSLLLSADFGKYIGPVTSYLEATSDHSAVPTLAGIYIGIKDKQTRWPIMWSLIRLAGDLDSAQMLAALKTADFEEAGRLSKWFARHPDEEATAVLRKLVHSQTSPTWDIAASLAALKDKDVVEWAQRTVAATPSDDSLTRALALVVIAISPLPEAESLASEILMTHNLSDISALVEGYLGAPTPKWDKLRAIPELKSVSEEYGWLKRTLQGLADTRDQNAIELLQRL